MVGELLREQGIESMISTDALIAQAISYLSLMYTVLK